MSGDGGASGGDSFFRSRYFLAPFLLVAALALVLMALSFFPSLAPFVYVPF